MILSFLELVNYNTTENPNIYYLVFFKGVALMWENGTYLELLVQGKIK